jgi:hypothetical protein
MVLAGGDRIRKKGQIAMHVSRPSKLVSEIGLTVCVAAIVWGYCASYFAFAHRFLWAKQHVATNVSIAVMTGIIACAIVWLTNKRIIGRVAVVSVLSVVGALIGVVFLSDPHLYGSYDHGFGETDRNSIVLGIGGTLAGYGIACVLLAFRVPRKCASSSCDASIPDDSVAP